MHEAPAPSRYEVLDALADEAAVLDERGHIVFVNAAWRAFAEGNGGSSDGYLGRSYLASSPLPMQRELESVLDGTTREFHREYPCHSPTTRRWFLMRASRLPSGGAVVLHTDITARYVAERTNKELAEASQTTSRRLAHLLDMMTEGVVVHRATVTLVNRSAEKILGLHREQIVGRAPIPPTWHVTEACGDGWVRSQRFLPDVAALAGPAARTLRIEHADGTSVWVIATSLLITDVDDTTSEVLTTFHDITHLKETELAREQLAHHRRLVTVGTLAAGVGHEINNPLTSVLTNLYLAMEEVDALSAGARTARLAALAEALEEARKGADRIRTIVRGLGTLARIETHTGAVDLRAAIALSLQIAEHELRTRAHVTVEVSADAAVAADVSQVSQVLVHLLVNAAQSFATAEPAKNQVSVTAHVEEGGLACVKVSDNGPGIAPENLAHVFDPFFTTKGVGGGTGLGLAICHGVVSSVGGRIEVESRHGEGTTFTVHLPLAPDEATAPD